MTVLRLVLLSVAGVAMAQHDMGTMDHGTVSPPSTLLVAPGTPSLPATHATPTAVVVDESHTAVVPAAATTSADHDPHATMAHGPLNNSTSTTSSAAPSTETGAPLPAGEGAISTASTGLFALFLALGVAAQL